MARVFWSICWKYSMGEERATETEFGPMTRSLQGFIAATAVLATCLALEIDRSGAQGGRAPRADARTPIHLAATERAHLRQEMRAFLERVQGVVEGLTENNMTLVAENARRAGMEMLHDVPISVATKLPPAFVLLSMDTHQKFDALSLEAVEIRTKIGVLKHLRGILANCTGCHATYRIVSE